MLAEQANLLFAPCNLFIPVNFCSHSDGTQPRDTDANQVEGGDGESPMTRAATPSDNVGDSWGVTAMSRVELINDANDAIALLA